MQCKKNKIPTNITNVDMADTLIALHQVDVLDEIVNPIRVDVATFVGGRRATNSLVSTTKIENPSGISSQRIYITRLVTLLESGLSKMSLIDTEDIGFVKFHDVDVSQELGNISHQVEDLCDKSKDQGFEVLLVHEKIIANILPSDTFEDALVGITYQASATLAHVVADEDVVALIPKSLVSDAPTNIKKCVEYNTSDAI
ncbi:hypothetical protein DEO72_LG2g1914 [Vigna unguiculata]|uniref:Uncharacterized protein n=1 Tax=Vigna unguiculata TaxID=3917 RepID=A0A4D6KYE8_VIGUN|nr:hypothetical protein DEO72_LG2g1914 [Vigna unguiculata]